MWYNIQYGIAVPGGYLALHTFTLSVIGRTCPNVWVSVWNIDIRMLGVCVSDIEGVEDSFIPIKSTHALFTGRRLLTTTASEINSSNIVDVLNSVRALFGLNRMQIDYLWRYYKGDQPVLWDKVEDSTWGTRKEVRPEIDYRVVENHAKEIVDFKVGYQLAEPMQYVLRNHDGTTGAILGEVAETESARAKHTGEINELNTLMFADGKESTDRDLFEWLCVGGIGFRLAEVSRKGAIPFTQWVLDPRDTFVVYSADYRHEPILGVWVGKLADGSEVYNAWTPTTLYRVVSDNIVSATPHSYGRVPIIEYQLNTARMGVFEPALPILNAINAVESNRLNGIEQTVQSLMKFINCDITEESFEAMLKLGAVKVSSRENLKADVDFITNDLDQSQTQVTKDDLYQALVNICGMPNRNGTSGSSSDTGAAVLLRDGWSLAESHAKGYELEFKRSEREFLALVLDICEQSRDVTIELRLRDIELKFNRRNYENLLVKVQALTGMLPADFSIHPEEAFKTCGLFSDAESSYLASLRWTDEHQSTNETDSAIVSNPGSQAGTPELGANGANTPVT